MKSRRLRVGLVGIIVLLPSCNVLMGIRRGHLAKGETSELVGAFVASRTGVNFGSIRLGQTSSEEVIELRNTGRAANVIHSVVLPPGDAVNVTANVPPMLPALQIFSWPTTGVLVVRSLSAKLDFGTSTFALGPVAASEHPTTNAIPNEAPAASAAFRFMRMSCLPSLCVLTANTALKKNVPQRVA